MSTKQWIILFSLGIIWGSSFLWIKIGVQEIGPLALVMWRVFFSLPGLLILFISNKSKIPGRHLLPIFFFLGLLNIVIPYSLFAWGEKHIPSALAAVLTSTMPLFTSILAHFLIKDEKITLVKFFGILTGFLGVIILLSNQLELPLSFYHAGQLAIMTGALSVAGASVYARLFTTNLKPDTQALGQQIFAFISILPLIFIFEAPLSIPKTPLTWISVAWLGILGNTIGFLLYYYLINSIGPSKTTLVAYLHPLVGTILGIIVLKEVFSWHLLVGGLLIIGGIALVNTNLSTRIIKSDIDEII